MTRSPQSGHPAIAVSTDGSVSAAALAWRYRGRLSLTVIVKAVFAIAPDAAATPAGAGEIVAEERTFDGHPSRSVEVASDLAPYRARCDVTFVGHAHAPGGRPAPAGSVRLGLARDGRTLIDKVLHVFGERRGGAAPEPFTRVPLVYERAFGGPGEPNPVGSEAPSVVDPADARRPAGYAPISRFWPARKRLLGKIDRKVLEAAIAEIPDELSWDYFQAAPADQQIELLRGGEWLVLDGVHPTLSRVQTRLPVQRGAARVIAQRPGAAPLEQAVELVCDGLAIDGDRQVLAMVWRGRYEVAGGEAALPSLSIAAALETPGTAIDWARIAARAPLVVAPVSTRAPAEAAGEGTMAVSPERAAQLAQQAAVPFAGAGAQPAAAPVSTAATPWGAHPVRAAPAAAPGEMTLGPGSAPARHEAPGESTFALRPDQQAAASQRVVAPFAIPSTGPASVRAAVPGAPWSAPAAPAPRPAVAGEETMALGGPPRSVPLPVTPPPSIGVVAPAPEPAASAPVAAGQEALAERLRRIGVSGDDVALLLAAITPPVPAHDAG